MAAKNVAVFGMYPHRSSFEYALSALMIAKFPGHNISALIQHSWTYPSGMTFGPTLGLLAEPRTFVIPGHGSFLIAGPLAAALTGTEDGNSVGDLTEALFELGIPEFEAETYQGRIKNGGVLLFVHCDDPNCVNKAKNLLKSTGAEHVSSSGEFVAD